MVILDQPVISEAENSEVSLFGVPQNGCFKLHSSRGGGGCPLAGRRQRTEGKCLSIIKVEDHLT